MEIQYFADIRELTKQRELHWNEPASTVGVLLGQLTNRYGEAFRSKIFRRDELSDAIIILVNGRNIVHLGNLEAPLKPNDVVSIFPKVAGG